MATIPSLQLDFAIPTSISNAANRVQEGVSNLNTRYVLYTIAAVIGGPLLLATVGTVIAVWATFKLLEGVDLTTDPTPAGALPK